MKDEIHHYCDKNPGLICLGGGGMEGEIRLHNTNICKIHA